MGIIAVRDYFAGLAQGQADFAVPGTGLSLPTGVDSVLEYNGLYFNNRQWADTYLINAIDGLNDADIRDSREVNPGIDGETAFNAFYGGRTIVLTGRIRAFTLDKLRDLQSALRQAFHDLTEKELILHNLVDPELSLSIYCRKSQQIVMAEQQQNLKFERDFQVTLRASNPRFLSLLPYSKTRAAVDIIAGQPIMVTNNGTYGSQPVISITGPAHAPIITNDTTGKVFSFTTSPSPTVPAGSTMVIDVAKRRVYDFATSVNMFARVNVSSEWPELVSGDNQINFSASSTSGASALTVQWRHTYM